MSTQTDLTKGTPWKIILSFAVPILFTSLLQQFYNIVDTAVVGRYLGKDALAGVGSTGSINFLIIGFCIGICMGFVIPVAQRYGAKDFPEMRRFVANAVWAAFAFAVVITIVVSLLCHNILVIMRTPDNIIHEAYSYISVILLGIPITIAYNLLAGIIRSLGDSKSPFIILMMASVFNIGGDIFAVTKLGLGVRGPALATLASQAFSAIMCLLLIVRNELLKISRDEWKFKGEYVKTICGMGIPMGLQYSITAIGSVILQIGINSLGSSAVAAVTAATRVTAFTSCPTDSLGSAMATYAGQNMGAKKLERVGQGLKVSVLIGFIYSVVLFGILFVSAKYVILLFVNASETQIINNAVRFILCSAGCYMLLVIVNTFRFTIQGLGYSSFAMISGMMEMTARATAGIILVPAFGFASVCIANPAAWLLADIFLIPGYCYCIKMIREKLSDNPQIKFSSAGLKPLHVFHCRNIHRA